MGPSRGRQDLEKKSQRSGVTSVQNIKVLRLWDKKKLRVVVRTWGAKKEEKRTGLDHRECQGKEDWKMRGGLTSGGN